MTISNLKIANRLGLAFGLMLLLIVGVAFAGWNGLRTTQTLVDVIVSENVAKIKYANDMQRSLNIVARATRNYLIYQEPAYLQKQRERVTNARKQIDEAMESLPPLLRSDKAKSLAAEFRTLRGKYYDEGNRILAWVDEGEVGKARDYLRTTQQATQDRWFEALAEMIALQESQNADAVERMEQNYVLALEIMGGALLAAILAGATLALLISRSIVQPLQRALAMAQAVAGGDLTSRIEVRSRDETGQLMQALSDMNDALKNVVGQIRSGTDSMATASAEIASGNLDLSARTEQQASSLEETASSMEEMTSTVKQNAANARQARELADAASAVAQQGGAVVARVVDTMGEISASSRKIVEIISVIDGIAFQTNILALNAAVEAARAGEQGRGFAVVATEVRNLAQRSAAAAREIKVLIGDSVDKVEFGSKLVTQAGGTMGEIVAGVQRVTAIMADIAAASREQEAGIEQINQAVSEMDTVTQQNAALVEQAAAAAAALQEQAAGLAATVSVFKLAESAQAASLHVVRHAEVLRLGHARPAGARRLRAVPSHDMQGGGRE